MRGAVDEEVLRGDIKLGGFLRNQPKILAKEGPGRGEELGQIRKVIRYQVQGESL